MKNSYVFSAVFTYAEDGISVEFPDLPGCFSCGSTDEEAVRMATEALELHLFGMERDGDAIPAPMPALEIPVNDDQVVVLIRANMRLARMEMSNKAVKKTLTIPYWLNEMAEAHNVNFSQVLQEALKDTLGLPSQKTG
jgi:predicted RNase H-like HicB family nuclease